MKILLLYATNSGNTYYVAERIASALRQDGVALDMVSAGDAAPDIFTEFDAVVLGSCTWNRHTATAKFEEGQLQDQMQKLVDALKGRKFDNKKFAVFGLGDANYMRFCAAADHLERFVKEAEGNLLVPSLRIDSFPQTQDAAIDAWAHQLATQLKG
ncbi:MAG: flavodoxin family protein [Patescibacteria group bacterium]